MRIWYRYHPFHGQEVTVRRWVSRFVPNEVVVRLPDGRDQALAAWMLDEQLCAAIRDEAQPNIDLAALRHLCSLLDAQPLSHPHEAGIAGEPVSPEGDADAAQTGPATSSALSPSDPKDRVAVGSGEPVQGSAQPNAVQSRDPGASSGGGPR